MKIRLSAAAALAAVALFAVACAPPPADPPPTTSTTTTAPLTFQQEAVNSINAARAATGAAPVTLCARLTTSAQRHSDDMALNGFLSFTGSDGSTAFQRMNDAGYFGVAGGELIAQGFPSSASVVQAWLDEHLTSPTVLNPQFEHVGVGRSATGNYWTTDWGAGGICDPA